jgi:hypothetical protein
MSIFHLYKNIRNYPQRWVVSLPIIYALTCTLMWQIFNYDQLHIELVIYFVAVILIKAILAYEHVRYIKWDLAPAWLRARPTLYILMHDTMAFLAFVLASVVYGRI